LYCIYVHFSSDLHQREAKKGWYQLHSVGSVVTEDGPQKVCYTKYLRMVL